MKIIYLHGLASVGTSLKSAALIKEFGEGNVFAPDLPLDPNQTIKIITDYLKTFPIGSERFVFVGTSLGGFWANFFAQIVVGSRGILVNPMLIPGDVFVDRIGKEVINYKNGTTDFFTKKIVDTFKVCQDIADAMFEPKKVFMFLAKDDEVINYKGPLAQSPGSEYFITDDGGHRYDINWGLVIAKLQEMADD